MKTQSRPPRAKVREIIEATIAAPNPDRAALFSAMRRAMANTKFAFPTSMQLWLEYRDMLKNRGLKPCIELERALRVKNVRTDSGVAPITVLTKPWACPGKCVYCPTEARMPKSYISSEPAAARALSLDFDPYRQVTQRVEALERNGHEANKIELIIKGGTWSAYPWNYRKWFIKRCFDAANHLRARSRLDGRDDKKKRYGNLAESQTANEKAGYRIIGLTIETRPDWVNAEEAIRLRELGCTRVEMGVQTLRDDILKLTKRGHTIADTVRATALLKLAGFKVDYHILPGQPGMTPKKDLADFKQLFEDPRFRPDMVKIYPCVVLANSELFTWTEEGKFKPLEGNKLRDLLIDMKTLVPRYCRISRMIRDFPSKDIAHGSKTSNLRDEISREMEKRNLACLCLRCREVGHTDIDTNVKTVACEEWYENAGGREVFLTLEDKERKAVFAFLRLRLPDTRFRIESHQGGQAGMTEENKILETFPVLKDAAIVRELHTYGTALDLKETRSDAAQHKGYGRKLMELAEEVARREGYGKVAVISGVGVRGYYRMLGYKLQQTYMVKKLKK